MTYSTPAPADPPIWNPDFGVINGVNQTTTLVAGVDERIKGSKLEDNYWIGQYFRGQDGSIDYDLYYLYTGLDVNYAASEYLNNWSDITFADVRYADSIYESLTLRQQQNVDWVRGLAIQLGYFNMFCIDEPDWYCAYLSPEPEPDEDAIIYYESAILDPDADLVVVNTFAPVAINSNSKPFRGDRQTLENWMLK